MWLHITEHLNAWFIYRLINSTIEPEKCQSANHTPNYKSDLSAVWNTVCHDTVTVQEAWKIRRATLPVKLHLIKLKLEGSELLPLSRRTTSELARLPRVQTERPYLLIPSRIEVLVSNLSSLALSIIVQLHTTEEASSRLASLTHYWIQQHHKLTHPPHQIRQPPFLQAAKKISP